MSDSWNDRSPWSPPSGGSSPDPWAAPGPAAPPTSPPDRPARPGWHQPSEPQRAWETPSVPPGYPTGPPLGGLPTPTPTGGQPDRRTGSGWKWAVVVLGGMCLILTGISIGLALDDDGSTTTTATGNVVTPLVDAGTTGGTVPPAGVEPAFDVARVLGPTVVQLIAPSSRGSGVIYDSSGLILTNAHVVEGSRTLDVQFSNGDTTTGRVLGADSEADVAVVKVDQGGLVAARLSQSKVVVGQMAIAIGSPYGLSESVTAGIVSAVDRPFEGQGNSITINMIQTDAPINPGNSGGALANRSGEVIGINTAIYTETGGNAGIGFAIPIETAKTIADKIVAGEPLDHGYLGVSSVPPDDGSGGAQINDVTEGSPADAAGLQTNDIVIAADDAAIENPQDLSARVVAKSPGDTMKLKLRRGGAEITVDVTLGKREPGTVSRPRKRPTTPTTR